MLYVFKKGETLPVYEGFDMEKAIELAKQLNADLYSGTFKIGSYL